ncbi:MAG: hypothetical protein ABW007_17625, partial [Chitinophagaceae bacterium]
MKIFLPTFLHVCLLCCFYPALAQTHTPRNTSMISNSGGYYEYLPAGYSSDPQLHPLIIFIHGFGQLGTGTGSELSKVLWYGLPQIIDEGRLPSSFTVNGQTHRPVIISPQFKSWPTASDIQGIINFITQNYRINTTRIYLTGMSMGGGVTWDYAGSNAAAAGKLAAIVPVCGASSPTNGAANIMSNAKLPVWATHNSGDPTVPVSNTNLYIDYINTPNPPAPAAKKTIFSSNVHDAWTQTYDPEWRENGSLNIYQWMLQYSRGGEIVLPVLLTNYTVTPNNAGGVRIDWTTAQEQDNKYFTIERSADGRTFTEIARVNGTNNATGSTYQYTDNAPLPGISYYRLSQTDLDGRKELFEVKQVNFNGNAVNKLQLYPNPASNFFTIRLNDHYSGKLQLRITTSSGQIAKT